MGDDPALPFVSVVVPVKDVTGLGACLEALAGQDYQHDRYEVIVVDNGAPSGAVEGLTRHRGFRPAVEAVPGSYRARNTGVRLALGEVLAFTDADCRPRPDWLSQSVRALQAGAGVVAGRVEVVVRDPAHPHPVEAYEVVHAFPQATYVARGGGSVTANMVTTRAAFDTVGLFRDDLLSGGDLEWSRRAHAAGFRTRYVPSAVVVHPARGSYRDVFTKLVRVHQGAAARYGGDGGEVLRVRLAHLVPPMGAVRRSRHPGLPGPRARVAYVAGSVFHRYAAVWAKVHLRQKGSSG